MYIPKISCDVYIDTNMVLLNVDSTPYNNKLDKDFGWKIYNILRKNYYRLCW